MSHRPFARRFRLFKAYRVTLQVLWSYGMLYLAGWVRGRDWVRRRRPRLHRRNARRVVRLILDLQGLFIKIGQLVSILTNFLPEDFRRELEGLQDHIPPRPLDEIHARIRAEFGAEPADLFASFEAEPIASASLAQVHEARLHDGQRVAVKVQHAYIEEVARMDLRTIRRILGFVGAVVGVRGLDAQYRQLQTMILEELDFAEEARHIEAIAANFEGHAGVAFPRVIHERSSARVLTTEYVDGVKVTDLEALDALGIDRDDLAERIVEAYCRMIFSDGLYHADPHPGNLLVRSDGTIVFIDFGAVARLSPAMKAGVAELVMGLLRRDVDRIVKALRQIGFVTHGDHEGAVDDFIERVYSLFLSQVDFDAFRLQDITAESVLEAKMDALADFNRLGLAFSDLTATFQVPKDWVLLQRTILLLLGLCTHLSPAMNPLGTIRPYLETFVLGPEQDWRGMMGTVARDLVLAALAVPAEMRRLLARANRGEAEVRVYGLQESVGLLYALGHQMLYGLLALGSGILAYLAHTGGDAVLVTPLVVASGFFGLCLGVSMFRARKWRR